METDRTPEELLENHKATGEPLDEEEVQGIVDAGLSTWDEWEDRGGGLYWLAEAFPLDEE
jgi:hypothetical protein